eukprot:6173143-Pleurochrysis_carterae.AAC.1
MRTWSGGALGRRREERAEGASESKRASGRGARSLHDPCGARLELGLTVAALLVDGGHLLLQRGDLVLRRAGRALSGGGYVA